MFRNRETEGWRDAVDKVIDHMDRHFDEPLTLSELSAIAAYSPFHFSRIFKQYTGVTPLYYMSALRIQKAKELLLNTDLTVRDVGLDVGQTSLGTFTAAFSEKVGMSPSIFRDAARQPDRHQQAVAEARAAEIRTGYGSNGSVICGRIAGGEPLEEGLIVVGLFTRPVPEGMPLYFQILKEPGFFRLAHILPGTYYLFATVIAKRTGPVTLMAKSEQPFQVSNSLRIWEGVELTIRERLKTDPPILVFLPLLMRKYLQQLPQTAICEK